MTYRYIETSIQTADPALPILRDYGAEIRAMVGLTSWYSAEPETMTVVDDAGTARCSALIDRASSPVLLTQATMAKRPAVLTNQVNGRGALSMSRARLDEFTWASAVPAGLTSPFSVIHVFAHSQTFGDIGCIWGSFQSTSFTGRQYLVIDNAGKVQFGVGVDAIATTPSAAVSGVWRAAIASWNPITQTATLHVSGFAPVVDNVTGGTTAVSNTGAKLGASQLYNGANYNGLWAEGMQFSEDIFSAGRAADLATIKTYLTQQFGVQF